MSLDPLDPLLLSLKVALFGYLKVVPLDRARLGGVYWGVPPNEKCARMKLSMHKSRGPSITVIGAISKKCVMVRYEVLEGSNNSRTFRRS